ncbi:tyrosine-type recombinase/integrase [Deferrisoma palaeochoriense]
MPKPTKVPKVKITKRTLDALNAGTLRVHGVSVRVPEPGEDDLFLRDTEQRGFGVRVAASGTVTFVFERRFRGADGRPKTKRWALGRFGDLTVDQARKLAEKRAGELAEGEDPDAKTKAAELEARTLADAVADYLETRDLKERTRRDVTKTLNRNFGDWMGRRVTDLRPDDIRKRYKMVSARAPGEANRAFRYLRAVLGFVRAAWRTPAGEPVLRENPVKVLSAARAWKKLQPRRTVIEPHELGPWFEAVLADPDPVARDFLRFVLLTGCRRSEATNLTWDQVDLLGGKVTFRDTKARRDHVLPLGPYLWEVLKRRRETAGDPWVFSERATTDRRRQNERFENVRYALGRIQKASGVTFTLHDLRRTFATVAESLDLSSYAVKALLNHALPREDVTAGYLRLTPERLRDAMEKVERRILTLAGIEPGAEVILFPGTGNGADG